MGKLWRSTCVMGLGAGAGAATRSHRRLWLTLPLPLTTITTWARAGLLANSGSFVSKCVLRCFAGVLWCFAGVLRCFASVLQYFHKTHKTHEKHQKTLMENTKIAQYARVLREFSKSKKSRLYCTKHFSQNICKTPQNTRKTVTKRVL